jgi:hypothetical protein
MRQVRRQAAVTRAANTDQRTQGIHEDGAPKDNLRNAQRELLDRMGQLLGEAVPLEAGRQAARQFAAAHPIGLGRPVDETALDELARALKPLADGPGRKLVAPLLLEDGGLAGALEAALFTGRVDKLLAELGRVRRLIEQLHLPHEAARMLVHVTSNDRFPVPFPLLGAAVVLGRSQAVIAAAFGWAGQMLADRLLDADAVRHILLPETLAAEHAITSVRSGPVPSALQGYLAQLRQAASNGLLSWEDLAAAAGLRGGTLAPLMRTAIKRGGETAAGHWKDHMEALAKVMLAANPPSAPSAGAPPPASS